MFRFVFIVLLCFQFSTAQDNPKLEGKWVDEKRKISYNFKSDGSMVFEQNGIPVFVNEVTLEAGDPFKAQFMMRQGGNSLTIPALIKVVNEETLWIEQFAPGQTPTTFSNRDT